MSDDWSKIESMMGKALAGEPGGLSALERIGEQVDAGRLDLSAVAPVLEDTNIGAEAARRVVKLWLELSDTPQVATDAEAMASATRLGRYGSFPATHLKRQPTMANWLAATRWRRDPMPREQMHRELQAYLDAEKLGETDGGDLFFAALRQFRHRQLLRIFLREIEGASVRRTTAGVADVAQACLQAALVEAAYRHGVKPLAEQLCIFGMGKLGGRELNFSSDVDLVFVVSDQGARQFSTTEIEGVARQVVRFIDEITDQGRVFRVDLRLRPEGSQGRLVPSASGLVDYLLNWGRTWERGAWLKARPVAGDLKLGERILEDLQPFLYRRHLDFDALDELRRMKELIDQEAKATGFVTASDEQEDDRDGDHSGSTSPFKAQLLQKFDRRRSGRRRELGGRPDGSSDIDESGGWDVKVGQGGIREIEFFVQALQLVHSGLRPPLRVRNTLEALDRLLYAGLVSAAEHRRLADAYDLFRRLEHLVQMEANRQSHRLPEDREQFADLAGRMQMPADALDEAVDEARAAVQQMFQRLFRQSPRQADRATVGQRREATLERLVGLSPEQLTDDSVIDRLNQAGFDRPRQVAGQLQVLRSKPHGPFSQSPTSADPRLARYLLAAVEDAPDPEEALGHLVRFSTVVGDTPSMWSMLEDHPHAARLLIHLFGSSQPVGRLLADEPGLFERLIYTGSAQVSRSRREMGEELKGRLATTVDRARRMGRIRRFHREELVRIALHEVAGAVDIETTCRQLTGLARLVIEALFREVVDEFCRGEADIDIDGDPVDAVGLSVVGMGKLGGGEMGFGSDLDFIFVYDSQGPHNLEHRQATRLAQRLVRAMSTATAIGDLYEVDLRLRPSGRQGTLVVSLDAWKDYHRNRAQFWERMALVRAAPLTGTARLRDEIERGRRQLGFERPVPDTAMQQVVDLRGRIAEEARDSRQGVDVKFGPGGLVDVEFLCQWLQINAGVDDDSWKQRSTGDVLRALQAQAGGGGSVDLAGLVRDWRWLRRLEVRLSLGAGSTVMPPEGPVRRAIARQMGHQGREEMDRFGNRLDAVRRRVRAVWEAVFGQSSG